jgi:hypothetical protein
MKAILTIATVVAALALAAPAGARPLYDPPLHPLTTPPAPQASDDTAEVAVIVGGAAFLLGAGAAQLVRLPRRRTA